MLAHDNNALFLAVRSHLASAYGKTHAITIDSLAMRCGCVRMHPKTGAQIPDRRPVEVMIEERLDDFPFLLVAGGRGYYRPSNADEINAYKRNLRRRHARLKARENTVDRKALAEGWPRVRDWYVDPPAVQQELFA